MDLLRRMLREIRVPEDFDEDWYGYATNQLSHFVLGFTTACVFSGMHFWFLGEFAEKGALWFTIAFIYAIWEVGVQKWRGPDSVEDWMFFSVYGAGFAILFFNETSPGSPELTTNMAYVFPAITILYGHLTLGIAARVYQKVRGDGG